MARTSKLPSTQEISLGFDTDTLELTFDKIMPLKAVTDVARQGRKYRQIVASIQEVGVIEPPVVAKDGKDRYILLDGHLRIEALKELGRASVICLLSTDDEAFTYNKYVNRLSPVQEHKMILRAVERGVSVNRIARALNMDRECIVRKKNMLKGICPEAAEILKDKMVAMGIFPLMKRMIPYRQIEAAALMKDANNYSYSYMSALLAATPRDQLVDPSKAKRVKGLDDAQMARMEDEMQSLQRDYQLIEESYGTDVLNLTLAKTWLSALLDNVKVTRYLSQHHPEILTQFQKLAEMTSLLPRDRDMSGDTAEA